MSGSTRIGQINASHGGVPKWPVASACVTTMGVQGDIQRDWTHHGRPERALCLFSQERIQSRQAEGHPSIREASARTSPSKAPTETASHRGICPRLGKHVVAEVTRFTAPCFNIRASFRDRDESPVSRKGHPGYRPDYARLRAVSIRAGNAVRFLTRDELEMLVARP